MKRPLLLTISLLLIASFGFAQNTNANQGQLVVKTENATIQNPPSRVETPNGHYEYPAPVQKQYIILETSRTILGNQIQTIESAILLNQHDERMVSQLSTELKALKARLQYVIDNNLN